MEEQTNKALCDLIEIIQFTENVSAKIHGILDKANIYRIVREEFVKSKQYIASILLLTDDESKLMIAETSLPPGKRKTGEKASGLHLKDYKIDLNKSNIYSQVIREGKTVQVNISDIIGELFPRSLAYLISKTMGYEKKKCILTPLRQYKKIIGALGMSSPELTEYFTPSVKNLAQHISNALELADEITEHKKVEETIEKSEKRFRALIESSSDIIQIVDSDGILTYVSPSVQRILGYSPEELIGKPSVEIVHPDDLPIVARGFERAFQHSGKSLITVCRCKHKDGTWRILEGTGTNYLDNPAINGFVSNIRDITKHKQAEKRIKRLNLMLRAIRNINQLIARERNRKRLLESICDNFVEVRGYQHTWLALLDEFGKFTMAVESGLGKNFLPMLKQMKHNKFPNCIRRVLMQSEVVVIKDPYSTCKDCPLADKYSGKEAMSIQLEYREKIYGLLSVSLPIDFTIGEEEQSLFKEVARDIAFALYNIELEEKRKKMEEIQRVLYQIATSTHTTKDINELFRAIHQELNTILDAKNFFIALYDKENNAVSFPYHIDEKDTFETYLAEKGGLTAYVIRNDKSLLVTQKEVEKLIRSGEVEDIGTPAKIWLGVPLKIRGEVIGAIVAQSYTDEAALGKKELEILKFVSNQIGLSIERKRAEVALQKEKNELQKYLDVVKVIIVVIDADQRTTLINKRGCEILGYNEKEIIGKNWHDNFISGRNRNEVKTVSQKLMAGEIESVEYFENSVLTKAGEERIIAWHNTVLTDEAGNIIGTLSSGEDITERKRAEAKIMYQNEQLKLANEKLKQLNGMKDNFISTVSHEFRTPLTSIKGSIEILLGGIAGSIDEKARELLFICNRNTDRLINLVNNLLDLQKIETGKIKMKKGPLNLTVLAHKVIEEVQSFAHGNRVTLKEDFPKKTIRVIGDKDRLSQVMYNLFSNAIKFSPDGEVTVGIKEEKDLVKVSVFDTGIGIPQDKLEEIFEEFIRIDSKIAQKWKGTGLGLSICKQIIQKHGGKIWVESKLGEGSNFIFTLPKKCFP